MHVADVRLVLESPHDSLQFHEQIDVGESGLSKLRDMLAEKLHQRFDWEVRISQGRYRRGSDVFDLIKISATVASITHFLVQYPRIRAGFVVLRRDVEEAVRAVLDQFASDRGQEIKQARIKQPARRKIKNAVQRRRKPPSVGKT